MDFILKKKQYRFDVSLKIEDLSSVPFVNAVLYCKLRFIGNGKKFIGQTPGEELQDHRVVWNKLFTFPCKMTANNTTMELDATFCRISIRRELKGGRAHHKIGFVDLNLSEYAGSGSVSRRFLLEGYHSSSRLDNSILKISVGLNLICGDVCFKVPKPLNATLNDTSHDKSIREDMSSSTSTPSGTKIQFNDGTSSLSVHHFNDAGNKTFMSSSSHVLGDQSFDQQHQLQHQQSFLPSSTTITSNINGNNNNDCSNSKSTLSTTSSTISAPKRFSLIRNSNSNVLAMNSNNVAQQQQQTADSSSQSSASSTLLQSRSSSENAINKTCINRTSGGYSFASMPRPNAHGKERRMDTTRIDADQLVDEVIRSSDLNFDAHSEGGLQLIIRKDGSTVLGSLPRKDHLNPLITIMDHAL